MDNRGLYSGSEFIYFQESEQSKNLEERRLFFQTVEDLSYRSIPEKQLATKKQERPDIIPHPYLDLSGFNAIHPRKDEYSLLQAQLAKVQLKNKKYEEKLKGKTEISSHAAELEALTQENAKLKEELARQKQEFYNQKEMYKGNLQLQEKESVVLKEMEGKNNELTNANKYLTRQLKESKGKYRKVEQKLKDLESKLELVKSHYAKQRQLHNSPLSKVGEAPEPVQPKKVKKKMIKISRSLSPQRFNVCERCLKHHGAAFYKVH